MVTQNATTDPRRGELFRDLLHALKSGDRQAAYAKARSLPPLGLALHVVLTAKTAISAEEVVDRVVHGISPAYRRRLVEQVREMLLAARDAQQAVT